jgi:hypothetical protein
MVRLDEVAQASRRLCLAHHILSMPAPAAGQNNLRSFGSKKKSGSLADAAGAACDNGYFSGEFSIRVHRAFS